MRLMRLLGLLLCLLAQAAGGQGFINPAPWSNVRGEAVALSIAADGFVMAAGRDGRLWMWNGANTSWNPLAGEGTRIAALPGGRYFTVRRDGELAFFDGLRFTDMGLRALDVAIDRNGLPYAIRQDGALVRRIAADAPWETLAQLRGRRLAFYNDGSIWIALNDGKLLRWQEGRSDPLPGSARELAIGSDGGALAVDNDGKLQRWLPFNNTWEPEDSPPDITAIAFNPQNVVWAASARGGVFTRETIQQKTVRIELTQNGGNSIVFGKRTSRGGTPAGNVRAIRAASYVAVNNTTQQTDPAPFEWIDTQATAASLTIAGRDGSVYALDNGGNIGRWSNQQRRFNAYPGSFAKIVADPDGTLWGLNALGRLFRRDGALWKQIAGNAADFSIGLRGQVFATLSTGDLFQYDAPTESLRLVPGQLFSVAVAPDGVPWGLQKDGTVARCATPACQRFGQTANSIAIGPDGSVFVVTNEGELRRLRKTLDGWDIIPVLGLKVRAVAVGPRGRPWVVADSGRVYATTFFPRDESTDLIEASTGSKDTVGSGNITPVNPPPTDNGFTFSKNLLFDRISVPFSADGLSLGPDGTVLMLYQNVIVHKLDNTKKTFTQLSGLPSGNFRYVKTGPDGKLWVLSSDIDGRVYHQISGSSYETIQVPIPNPSTPSTNSMNRIINIGPDGSVYVIDTAGTLWRRPFGSTAFAKLIAGTYKNVAITRANDVWVMDNNDVVRQIVNNVAVARQAKGVGNVQAFDIAGGQDGSVYITSQFGSGSTVPAKWNGNSLDWDRLSNHADVVGVAPDGRPTLFNTDGPDHILRAK